MADEKKPSLKSPKPPKPKTHPMEPVIILFFVAAALSEIIARLAGFGSERGFSDFFHTLGLFIKGDASFSQVIGSTGSPTVAALFFILRIISFTVSALFVWGIITTYRKYVVVNKKIHEPLHAHHHEEHAHGHIHAPDHATDHFINKKWVKVLEHINSSNASDWRLAILEADIMLGEMLEKMGYHGATIADRLKGVESSDFNTLQEAWDAHKIRNAIAHEGTDYALNKPEAERVVKLFKKVFEEFKYI